MAQVRVAFGTTEGGLADLASLLSPGQPPAGGEWEVEIGFGKGRYLLAQAAARPQQKFLGIEVASQYYRLVRQRAIKRGLGNVVLIRGEAHYLLSAALPRGFASAVHVYFPDPWPKARHHARRLFDPETVDLVLGLLARDGTLYFASDFLDYAALVGEILDSHPGFARREIVEPWDGVARTNYEAKYIEEGRRIARFEVRRCAAGVDGDLHPAAVREVRAAVRYEPEAAPES